MRLKDQIKAICFDYDGTLVDYEARMSDYTKTALKKLKEAGYKLALITGRRGIMAYRAMSGYADPEVFDYIFGFNGSETYDLKTKTSKFSHLFDVNTLKDLAKMLDDPKLMLLLYEEDYALANHFLTEEFMKNWSSTKIYKPRLLSSPEDIPHPFPKYAGVFDSKDRPHIDALISKIHDDRVEFLYSAPTVLEIIPRGMNKGVAIDKLMELENLNREEIMAVGDASNDLGMLEACVGVVMENGLEELKKRFPIHADDVYKEGIYGFFKREGFIF